ncbi:MAG: flavodoxin domain-containing protein [Bacteroidales bacterium]|nr:flavodoxin domain-containing protein [Bacteroidales bacterium]
MEKIVLIFWPEAGNVEKIADALGREFNPGQIEKFPVSEVTEEIMNRYNFFIFGGSTAGAETWRDASDSNRWSEFFLMLDKVNLENKKVAFYGLGDQILYPLHFVDGLGVFEKEFSVRGAFIAGRWPDKGYDYTESEGVSNGMFYGLALDEDNESDLSPQRLSKWALQIKKEFGLE